MNKNFSKEIEFDEYLFDMLYLIDKKLIHSKLYFGDEYKEVSKLETNPSIDGLLTMSNKKWPSCIRKGIFIKEKGKGIIIGQTFKKEGIYHPYIHVSSSWDDDFEPAWLEQTKTLRFWIVATDMNKTVLVEKKENE